MSAGPNIHGEPVPSVAGLSDDRQVEIMTWIKNLPPHEADRAAQSMIRAGGDEAQFVQFLLSKDRRSRGESPHDKKTNPPQTK